MTKPERAMNLDGRDKPKYDLEERLLDYAASIILFTEGMLKTEAARHIAGQLLRSGTAPLGHQGEAVSAESPKDFIHKMKVGLKELRESLRWLKLSVRVPFVKNTDTALPVLDETEQLIRIFVASIRTAKSNSLRPPRSLTFFRHQPLQRLPQFNVQC